MGVRARTHAHTHTHTRTHRVVLPVLLCKSFVQDHPEQQKETQWLCFVLSMTGCTASLPIRDEESIATGVLIAERWR